MSDNIKMIRFCWLVDSKRLIIIDVVQFYLLYVRINPLRKLWRSLSRKYCFCKYFINIHWYCSDLQFPNPSVEWKWLKLEALYYKWELIGIPYSTFWIESETIFHLVRFQTGICLLWSVQLSVCVHIKYKWNKSVRAENVSIRYACVSTRMLYMNK